MPVSASENAAPLEGLRVLTLAVNLPGPVAASRLAGLGARVTKVEPPAGDPLALACEPYYRGLLAGQEVVQLDLKADAGRVSLWELLEDTDLLLTSSRPRALERLGLDWESLHARLPRLSQVAIVGHPGAGGDLPGHDLTYQAGAGVLRPPQLPTVLVADLAGAERAVADGLALLLQAARTGRGGRREVALSEVAEAMAEPAGHGLTAPGGLLGGALPGYGIYPTRRGYVAVAALESHFWDALVMALGIGGSRGDLEAAFAARTAAEWEAWGAERGLPIAAIREPGDPTRSTDRSGDDGGTPCS
ncbi:CoA transferase [Allobranchiibius sp. CTAmp26]|uniref:CoA transferase n=1 Tax=Allobranchiibius sp. CTAmp26 TaxID=2815214 RepID=UPI001AA1D0A6|nr:CoA transferase [Allobranchiibius sp. CTAmp26]MBO1754976.1 CoA transferase [Allobranchiibius sp. CTAmp26]